MIPWAIVDTGPLVAYLDRRDGYHAWSADQVRKLKPPLLTCEAVLTETLFIMAGHPAAKDELFRLMGNGALNIDFSLADHLPEIKVLLTKYEDQPMSLADACLVRMAELNEKHSIFTLDSDFKVYRKNGKEQIPLIAPGI